MLKYYAKEISPIPMLLCVKPDKACVQIPALLFKTLPGLKYLNILSLDYFILKMKTMMHTPHRCC